MVVKGLLSLVIVPGHGVCKFWRHDLDDKKSWYARNPSEGTRFIGHIRAGVIRANNDKKAALIFSGGQTVPNLPLSEGLSYLAVAEKRNWFRHSTVQGRAFVEDYARDSFENLLFSILKYHNMTATWPTRIDVVGWIFKKERFCMHAKVLGYSPGRNFEYRGVNNPRGKDLAEAERGEEKARRDFEEHPWGEGQTLANKRLDRDPFMRGGLLNYEKELREFLDMRGSKS